jgi:hypothetical protein
MGQLLTLLALLGAAIYCGCQVVRDRRREQFGWAAVAVVVGLTAMIALLTMPVQTHAVKIDLPAPRS